MEIRQLKYFLKVAETLNFSEASRKLYITQSTLSQQISHLEQEIGLPLFERNSHEVYLTEAGKELLPYAQNAVNCTMACVDHMNDLKEMLTGELNIGVTYSFSNIMAETLIAFLHAYPHVKLNIQYRSMQELMDGLKKRELDLVLAFKKYFSCRISILFLFYGYRFQRLPIACSRCKDNAFIWKFKNLG